MSFRSRASRRSPPLRSRLSHLALAQSDGLEEIVVTADFREARIEELPISVSVLDRAELRATTQQHFEEAIRSVPNLNLSGEGSRARYFQLRGVGELEQYDGAPNPSIGFIVDDIDFSGLGSIAHVVRHRSRRGAARPARNALRRERARRARLHALASAARRVRRPTSKRRRAATARDALGAAVGGPLSDTLGYRASVQSYENNGFRDNVFLGRDDTYGRDELTARGKLAWSPSDDVHVDFTGLYVDVDNGYDAWAIDNGFNTYSDDPGRDAQRSAAGSAARARGARRASISSASPASPTPMRCSASTPIGATRRTGRRTFTTT